MTKPPRRNLRVVQYNGMHNRPNAKPMSQRGIMRNRRALEAIEQLPPYIDSRSDNISLLAPNLAALRPYLKP